MSETTKLWSKRACALVGGAYCALICWFSYLSIFYEVSIPNQILFCVALSAISFVALAAMLYSRFQVLTKLVGILLLPVAFPIIMLCFGEWTLIIPISITVLLVFFLSGSKETWKTIFGVIYLLLYILGSLGYFMVISFFASSVEQTVLETGTSPSGDYRYELIQTDDSSGGNIKIHVEPNDKDISLPFITFVAVGYDRTVFMERPATTDDLEVTWTTQSRTEITKEFLAISSNLQIELSDDQKEILGLSADTEAVYLKDISDAQLAKLGVPEENDVLTFRGEVCFRSYIAILEDYFDISNRELQILE
ncbi:MAG: hypothetical protein LUF89_09415 [Ruminococcus sp.]|nr:hypothetical protein [Ruminococcus sp.]